MSFARKLLAVFAFLCLTGAQQAAFAHWAAHLGAPVEATLEAPDGDHAAATTLTQLCKSCVAFAGIDGALPSAALPPLVADPAAPCLAGLPQSAPCRTARPFDSRAPPAFL